MTATLDIEKLRELHEQVTAAHERHFHGARLNSFTYIDWKATENELLAYVRTHLPEILERLSRT